MPEGDTIWRTAAALRPRLCGRRVVTAEPAPLRRLSGRVVEAVEPVGKHLLIRFDDGLVLHSHMMMTGSWHLYGSGQRWRKPARQRRALLELDDGTQAVCFNAPVVELHGAASAAARVAHLGPDVLALELDLDAIVARVPKSEAATLGELLLDQRVAAGIGNIWRCETMWRLRLDPWTPVGRLDEPTLRRAYTTTCELMRRALVGAGFERSPAVHGRAGRACRRCGTPVARRAQGPQARLTSWCPRCQVLQSTVPA